MVNFFPNPNAASKNSESMKIGWKLNVAAFSNSGNGIYMNRFVGRMPIREQLFEISIVTHVFSNV